MNPISRNTLAMLCLAILTLPTQAGDKTDLDVSRVALFSSGVGYFECDALVTGEARAELKFRTDQINDILKSLVVQDFGGGRVGVVSYASQDPVEKTLRSFGVDLTGKPTLGELLDQLRGEPVEISGRTALSGVILGVEQAPVLDPDGKLIQVVERLTVLTTEGLQRIDLTAVQGIRLSNEKVDAELRKALATLATAHNADKKTVELHFEGTGERRVRVAYVLEAPLWKTSYRLVLSDEKKPFIQGWATVENATEEDWSDVRLSLVSGRPISFRMDLYTPLYVPRPLEQLELYASLRPPDYEGGFKITQEMRGEATLGQPPSMGRSGGRGGATRRMKAMAAPANEWDEDGTLDLAEIGIASLATAQEAGELFAYHIDTPVSIPRQHSAMLPIVNQSIEADKLSIYNPNTHFKHPLNGLELKNTTGLNLMQGPVTVFDGSIYAGDAKLPDLRPDEQRLIAYALDLSTEVLLKQQPRPEELVSVRIAKGTLWQRRKFVDAREYQIKNKAERDRTVLLEQPYGGDWKLVEPKKPYELTRNMLRFKLDVAAQTTVKYPVRLERISDESVILSNVGLGQIRFFLRARAVSAAVKQALERVITLRAELDDIVQRRARLEKELAEVVAEQVRIRENLKTLDRNTDAYQRQLKKFDQYETQIEELRGKVASARDSETQKRRALDDYLLSLNIE